MGRKKHFIVLTLVVLTARLVAVWQSGPSTIRFGDASDYLSAAASVCSTEIYPDHSSMPFFRAPGLPFFIAASTLCHPDATWIIKVALAIIGAITVLVIVSLTEDLFHDYQTSMIAGWVAALYPFFLVQSTDVQTESLFMMFFVISVWLTLRAGNMYSQVPLFLSGVSAALAALTRPVGLLLPFLLALEVFMVQRARGVRYKPYLLLCIGAGVALGPWVVRNELRFHEFILVNDAGGYNFWRGTSAEMAAINGITSPEAFTRASVEFERIITPRVAAQVDRVARTPQTRSQGWYQQAFADFRKEPLAFIARMLRNAWAYWRPWLNPVTSSGAVVLGSGLVVTLLYLFAAHGWILLLRCNRPLAVWCAISASAFWFCQIPFQVVARFRIPITDPFLTAFAAASVHRILQGIGKHSPLRTNS